jgi:hypothetical protein
MISNSIRHSYRRRYAALFLLLCGAMTAAAQNTPEMREILARLDRLEKNNQALVQEIRALRQELGARPRAGDPVTADAGSSEPASDGQALSSRQATTEEKLAVEQSRIDEVAQTKVETSQKFPLRITGMALFNAYVNGRFNNHSENPTIASSGRGDATGGGTFRQTTLGLLFNGPLTLAGGKVSGSVYMDFFGGSTSSLNHLVRLRTAAINLDWARNSFSFGQLKPLISPRDPDSLAQVGVSPLTGAGNLWLWQPQARFEHRLALGRDGGLRAQVAVFQTSLLNTTSDPNSYAAPLPAQDTEHSSPGGEARLELWRHWSESSRLEIAGGFHVNRNHVGVFSLPSNIYSLDWFFRPVEKVEFSGMFFHGRNVAVLGALRQGFSVLPNGRWLSVRSNGGWAQMRFPVTSRLTFNLYGGQQDDNNSDLVYANVAKNQAYFGNVMYRLAPNVLVSLEGGQVRTSYYRLGNRLNDHYDLGIAYLF